MVRQAQSREKLLQKKLEEGLTEKPQRDAEWDFAPDPGELPTPVLRFKTSRSPTQLRTFISQLGPGHRLTEQDSPSRTQWGRKNNFRQAHDR